MSNEDGMPGSRAANQGKTESIPPTQGHPEPDAGPEPDEPDVPELAIMNVGAGDPQAPNHPAAGPAADKTGSGVPALDATEPGAGPPA